MFDKSHEMTMSVISSIMGVIKAFPSPSDKHTRLYEMILFVWVDA